MIQFDMKHLHLLLVLCLFPILTNAQNDSKDAQTRITSKVDSSHAQNMVLEQTFVVHVPVDSVWNAFTTEEGWTGWATAQAEIDLKVNGTVRTHYDINGKLGDESSVTLHIINYVPNKLLTLQAEITSNFPGFMKEDEKDLFNTLVFEEITPTDTRVTSYGIGYKRNNKYRALMKFFIQGNEQSYMNLINYLETGEASVNY
jgi:uncharacterized protein YndB with AHSA1/START domain